MTTCIYCNKEKDDKEFSQEHVLPKAIGGVLQPINPFSTNLVCSRCNSISGFFIDAPFSKSWYINNYRSSNAAKYTKVTSSTILPLVYMGTLMDFKYGDKICENYLGPTGDTIYHFHDPYPVESDSPPMIGVPPHIRNIDFDKGFAFIFIASNNIQWYPTIFYSFVNAFKDSILYLGNGVTPNVKNANFKDIPEELKELHDKLTIMQDEIHNITFSTDVDMGNRFLAKLSLGLGCIFLNDSFKTSDDADVLRKYMWTKNKVDRDKIPVRGSGLLSDINTIDQHLKWDGAHVIGLLATKDKLSLYANFYGAKGAIIGITKNKKHWENKIKSIFFIVVPELQKCVGPISMDELISHRTGYLKNKDLENLENEMSSIPPLPPFII